MEWTKIMLRDSTTWPPVGEEVLIAHDFTGNWTLSLATRWESLESRWPMMSGYGASILGMWWGHVNLPDSK